MVRLEKEVKELHQKLQRNEITIKQAIIMYPKIVELQKLINEIEATLDILSDVEMQKAIDENRKAKTFPKI